MKAVLSIVLAVAFSTMSVLACGSETPTGNGTPTVASVVVTPANAPLVSLEETVQLTGNRSGREWQYDLRQDLFVVVG